jgi:hypothetical protein
MRNCIRGIALVLATITASGHAAAMSSSGHCTVLAGEKLPPASGGAQQLCDIIERAIGTAAPRAAYRAEITVISPARLSATLVVNGRPLPKQKFAIMDRQLNRGAIERFAHSLAEQVAKATKS